MEPPLGMRWNVKPTSGLNSFSGRSTTRAACSICTRAVRSFSGPMSSARSFSSSHSFSTASIRWAPGVASVGAAT